MSEIRFKEVFAHAPVSIWEEDFSEVGEWLASLRERGIEDLTAFLESDPQALPRALSLVRLLDVNEVTLRLWEVKSKEELLERWTDLFTDETFDVFAAELLAIWEGRNQVTFRCTAKTATGRPIHYKMHWVAPMVDQTMNLGHVIVAIIDITDHEQTEQALRKNTQLARRLSHRLLQVQEHERRHLARELHDEFGQLLAAVTLRVSAAREKAEPAVQQELDKCSDLLDLALKQVRNLALELRPAVLDFDGLDAALRWLGEQYEQRTGIETVVTGRVRDVSDEVGISCFRVVQEALTNVTRHARAKHVWIEMSGAADGMQIVVRDDGVGFETMQANAFRERDSGRIQLGLLGMTERIEYLGGKFAVESHPGQGTTVRISLPLEQTHRNDA